MPPRRLETPTRDSLLAHFAKGEAISKGMLGFECAVIVLSLAWIVGYAPRPFGILPWVAFLLGFLGTFRWFLDHIFLNKKRLEQIRADASFGEHTRDSLVALTAAVFSRLNLKPGAAPVFLTRSKDVNAAAVRCELWPGVRMFNGVFLNRSILHLLDERELASIIGHELGHVFPYAPLMSRCYLIHASLAGILSFAITAGFNHPGVAILVPCGILWLLPWLIAYPQLRLSRGIEFLCDDYGARAAGLLPALSSEFKIAAEQETRQTLLLRMLSARQQGLPCSVEELVEAYDECVPFGKAVPETFEVELERFAAEKRRTANEVSLGSFLNFVSGGDDDRVDEALAEEVKRLGLLQQLPIVPLNRVAYLQGSHTWSLEAAHQLVQTIEYHPCFSLFRLDFELDDRECSHPNPSRRILYLWRNRDMYPGVPGLKGSA
jgi:Zn-dependent protease with chaperone function